MSDEKPSSAKMVTLTMVKRHGKVRMNLDDIVGCEAKEGGSTIVSIVKDNGRKLTVEVFESVQEIFKI